VDTDDRWLLDSHYWFCFELWIQTMQQQRHYGDEEDVGAREKALIFGLSYFCE